MISYYFETTPYFEIKKYSNQAICYRYYWYSRISMKLIDHRWWPSFMEEFVKEIALDYFRNIGFDWLVSFSIRSQYLGSSSFTILRIIVILYIIFKRFSLHHLPVYLFSIFVLKYNRGPAVRVLRCFRVHRALWCNFYFPKYQ